MNTVSNSTFPLNKWHFFKQTVGTFLHSICAIRASLIQITAKLWGPIKTVEKKALIPWDA